MHAETQSGYAAAAALLNHGRTIEHASLLKVAHQKHAAEGKSGHVVGDMTKRFAGGACAARQGPGELIHLGGVLDAAEVHPHFPDRSERLTSMTNGDIIKTLIRQRFSGRLVD